MSRYGVLNVTFPQVPHFTTVVLATCDNVIPIRWPVSPSHTLQMSLQEHDTLASSAVTASSVTGTAGQAHLTIFQVHIGGGAPGDGSHMCRVTTQCPHQVTITHIPQFTHSWPAGSGQHLVIRTELAAGDWSGVSQMNGTIIVVFNWKVRFSSLNDVEKLKYNKYNKFWEIKTGINFRVLKMIALHCDISDLFLWLANNYSSKFGNN